MAHSVPRVTFTRILAGPLASIAGIQHVVLLLRSHSERWSGDDLDLKEAFRKRPRGRSGDLAGS